MIKVIICITLLVISTTSFCQQVQDTRPITGKEYYLSKSRTQKTIAFILLGAGITTIAIISKGNTDLNSVGTLAILGAAATVGSIPLFISSARNKKKAINATAFLNLEKALNLRETGYLFHYAPSISLKINLHKP